MTQQQPPSRQSIANRSENERIRYATILVEAILNTDHLLHAHALTPTGSVLLKQDKQETLAQIDELVEYLQGLRAQVEAVQTEQQKGEAEG